MNHAPVGYFMSALLWARFDGAVCHSVASVCYACQSDCRLRLSASHWAFCGCLSICCVCLSVCELFLSGRPYVYKFDCVCLRACEFICLCVCRLCLAVLMCLAICRAYVSVSLSVVLVCQSNSCVCLSGCLCCLPGSVWPLLLSAVRCVCRSLSLSVSVRHLCLSVMSVGLSVC